MSNYFYLLCFFILFPFWNAFGTLFLPFGTFQIFTTNSNKKICKNDGILDKNKLSWSIAQTFQIGRRFLPNKHPTGRVEIVENKKYVDVVFLGFFGFRKFLFSPLCFASILSSNFKRIILDVNRSRREETIKNGLHSG